MINEIFNNSGLQNRRKQLLNGLVGGFDDLFATLPRNPNHRRTMMKFIIVLFCIFSLKVISQSRCVIYNLKSNSLLLDKKNLITDSKSILFIGNNNLYFISKSKLNIFNLTTLKWTKKNNNIITNTNVYSANFNHSIVTKYDVNQLDVNEDKNRIGFTLKYGMFKEIDLKSLKPIVTLYFASDIFALKYLKKSEKILLYDKFYPDSMSKYGNLVLFEKMTSKNYKSILNISLQQIKTLETSVNEMYFGGITTNKNLWLYKNDTNKVETNVYVNDTLSLMSASFIGNDSIALLYNNNELIISSLKNVKYYTGLVKYDNLKYKFESFIYNNESKEFIAKSGKEIIVFTIVKYEAMISKSYKFDTNKFNYKLSPNGTYLIVW